MPPAVIDGLHPDIPARLVMDQIEEVFPWLCRSRCKRGDINVMQESTTAKTDGKVSGVFIDRSESYPLVTYLALQL